MTAIDGRWSVMARLTDNDRIRDTLKVMQRYFERCANNCQLGSGAYRLYSKYVATLDKVMKRIKEDGENAAD